MDIKIEPKMPQDPEFIVTLELTKSQLICLGAVAGKIGGSGPVRQTMTNIYRFVYNKFPNELSDCINKHISSNMEVE